MIARVTLEIALNREFDYSVPPELEGAIEVGSRVKVPFGHRKVPGCVTQLLEESPHGRLKPIERLISARSLITPKVLQLSRWIADYYCCAPETALKSVLPDAVRKEKSGWRELLMVRLLSGSDAQGAKLTTRQAEVLAVLEEHREMPLQRLVEMGQTTPDMVRRLEDKGLVQITRDIAERDPYAEEEIIPTEALALNPEQEVALAPIRASLEGGRDESTTFLLHGVTGSGKTEVYLQAIARSLELGKGALVLVPEISLTPQTVERFKARFSSGPLRTQVAVLHSHLSAGERHDEWHKIRQGRARIAIGARSAIFAPIDPLGLIIVDEEHEHSYKQEESPRYHARDVAVVRGRMENASVILGSATPSLESFYNASRGKYRLLTLSQRVDDKQMPLVRVVDMRMESRKQKGPPIFSETLKEAILQRLERREQVILFLNRRGYATSLQCPACGYVAECPNCSVSLTFHRMERMVRCHICGHGAQAPQLCPETSCRSPEIRYAGLGTEKVEDVLGKLFPKARVRRMDSDALKKKEDYRRFLGDFKLGKTDILVGTQMIAKGLHFPNVTLVGILHADLSLHQTDFRAGERTFQLLTQVAGRAGRGDVEGEVIVQAFTPFHPAIQYARRHDFEGFYEQELEFREQLKYPPFARVALLTLRGRNEDKVAFLAEHVRKDLSERLAGFPDLILSGPAPAPLARAESFFRYQLMLRTQTMSRLSRVLSSFQASWQPPEDVRFQVDIDPVNMS